MNTEEIKTPFTAPKFRESLARLRNKKLAALAAVLIIFGGGALYLIVIKPLLQRAPKPADISSVTPGAVLSDERRSAVELYLTGAAGVPDTLSRVELTLIKTSVKRGDGKVFVVSDKPVRMVLQKGIAQKLANDMIPAGPYDELILTFAPSGQLVPQTGAPTQAYLPNATVTLGLSGVNLPASRTLAMSFRVDLSSAFGFKENVPTLTLPKAFPVETFILGGIFRNERNLGGVWKAEDAVLKDVVKTDTGMDISPRPGQTGSPGYVPAATDPPQQ